MDRVRFLQIEPTTRCNFTCGFCRGRKMEQSDLAIETFDATLAALPDLEHIEIQGEGEPLLHPRFFEMVGRARGRGLGVSFITNGSLLGPEAVERILDLGVARVSVSVESPDDEEFRAIRGGLLSKVKQGIALLLRRRDERGLERPAVGMSVTVLRRTRDRMPAILALYRELGLDGGLTMQPLQRMAGYSTQYDPVTAGETLSDREAEGVWMTFLGDPEVRRIQQQRSPISGFYDGLMEGWRPGRRVCPWLERGLYVDRTGEATPCCMIKDAGEVGLGRVGGQPLDVLLGGRAPLRAALARGEVPAPCRGCELAGYAVVRPGRLVALGMRGLWRRWFGGATRYRVGASSDGSSPLRRTTRAGTPAKRSTPQ